MEIRLSRFIKTDLERIGDFIAEDNPNRAVTFVEELEQEIMQLADGPVLHRLRPDVGPGIRVRVYGRYLILFRVANDSIHIERVVQGSRELSLLRIR